MDPVTSTKISIGMRIFTFVFGKAINRVIDEYVSQLADVRLRQITLDEKKYDDEQRAKKQQEKRDNETQVKGRVNYASNFDTNENKFTRLSEKQFLILANLTLDGSAFHELSRDIEQLIWANCVREAGYGQGAISDRESFIFDYAGECKLTIEPHALLTIREFIVEGKNPKFGDGILKTSTVFLEGPETPTIQINLRK